ncbi:unnamed protein product [Bursaphelenchus okinawaensis]|uniref:Cadherin domain-containing protein n=1 Tax=Bursaphelenchus okinawaensis TaxID=465554 RepID=A0A811K4A4_9BILA|nr:unnamed protein product [Bursaphelenchus okinawaensis]CAG9091096.1 unnamed protein product [Bursaphelenchus okinawaensis]
MRVFVAVCLFLGTALAGHHKHHHRVPILQLNGADEILGSLREDEHVVAVSPHISIFPESGPVCKYELTSDSETEIPFFAEIVDKNTGSAVIKVKENFTLDCSHSEFNLDITAVGCNDDMARSEPASLKVTVKDTNNHAPEFDAPWYAFDVVEGQVAKNIAKLTTTDKDCGHPYGKICRYEITNALEGFPFHIDDQGVISNVKPLNRSDSESHILTIVAYDCGMQRSKSALVTINVRRPCQEGLRGLAASGIEYTPGTGTRKILPNAEVISCPTEQTCTVKSAESQLQLAIERPSEHDLASTKKCGMNLETLELLPRGDNTRSVVLGKDGKAKELLLDSDENLDKDTKVEESEEDDDEEDEDVSSLTPSQLEQQKYVFDGKTTSVVVPPSTVKEIVPQKFSLTFSMKHARGNKAEQQVKQNILCETDNDHLNRHHFAVYIRHCKLEMLLRREAEHASQNFRAAEWRWALPEVCDDEWHSYAILFHDLDNVVLMVDGNKYENTERNPEILDDWPLHETKWLKTKMVVGACWHGRTEQMVQFFKGHLTSVYLLPGKVESEMAVQCLHQPKERLRFEAVDELVPGETAAFAEQQTRLTLTSNTLEDLSLLLQKVEYINSDPTLPGKRRLTIKSSAKCTNGEKRDLGTFETSIQVKNEQAPILSISGQNLINTDRKSLKLGTVMVPDVQITVVKNNGDKDVDVTSQHKIDWCKVHLKPSRDMDLEYFSSPAALIASLNIDFEHDSEGILLKGEESISGYREVLSKIHYFNTRPEAYNKRMYTVQCAMDKGKLLSNKFFVTMYISDENKVDDLDAEARILTKNTEAQDIREFGKQFEPSAFDQLGANRLQNILEMDLPRPKALLSHHGYEMGQGAVAGGAVAIVVVICVGFLLVLLVVGVLKMRDTPIPRPRRRQRKMATMQEGMEWDDGGMNITVNPLEDVEKQEQEVYSEEEDESSDDGESYHDEDEMSEEEEEETSPALPHAASKGLEWDDDGTLTQSVSRTYRV